MSIALDVLSWVLLLAGVGFVIIGGIGVLRMPNLWTRMHAASLTDSAGSILIIVGIMFDQGYSLSAVALVMSLGSGIAILALAGFNLMIKSRAQ